MHARTMDDMSAYARNVWNDESLIPSVPGCDGMFQAIGACQRRTCGRASPSGTALMLLGFGGMAGANSPEKTDGGCASATGSPAVHPAYCDGGKLPPRTRTSSARRAAFARFSRAANSAPVADCVVATMAPSADTPSEADRR